MLNWTMLYRKSTIVFILRADNSQRWLVTNGASHSGGPVVSQLIPYRHSKKTLKLLTIRFLCSALRWRHNGRDGVSNHQPHDCLLNRLFGHRSKKTSKPRVTGLCAGNSPGTGEVPAQMSSNAETVSIWWRHHGICLSCTAKPPSRRTHNKERTHSKETPSE